MLPTTSGDLIPGDLIQLDHQATTTCHPLVVQAMEPIDPWSLQALQKQLQWPSSKPRRPPLLVAEECVLPA